MAGIRLVLKTFIGNPNYAVEDPNLVVSRATDSKASTNLELKAFGKLRLESIKVGIRS